MTTKLPEWPKVPIGSALAEDWEHYDNARIAYWESRCRLAVGGIRGIFKAVDAGNYEGAMDICEEVLLDIGPLPPKEQP